jgi:drug/metabolite transporter (DMT)-like permease
MINLILAIIFPVISVIIFKIFIKYKIRNLQAIVVNYLGAVVVGILLSEQKIELDIVTQKSWLGLSFVIGGLFLLNFYLLALAAQKISLSIATLANKISLVIPVIPAFVFFNEEVTIARVIGVLFVFVSIYLITFTNGKLNIDKKHIHLPILIFLVTGLVDTLLNYTQATQFTDTNEMGVFITVTFVFSFLFGLVFLVPKIKVVTFRAVFGGLVLSIPNSLGIYFLLKSLQGPIDTSVIFSILNIGSLLLAVLVGFLLFKERLRPINWAGVVLALVTIYILTI